MATQPGNSAHVGFPGCEFLPDNRSQSREDAVAASDNICVNKWLRLSDPPSGQELHGWHRRCPSRKMKGKEEQKGGAEGQAGGGTCCAPLFADQAFILLRGRPAEVGNPVTFSGEMGVTRARGFGGWPRLYGHPT